MRESTGLNPCAGKWLSSSHDHSLLLPILLAQSDYLQMTRWVGCQEVKWVAIIVNSLPWQKHLTKYIQCCCHLGVRRAAWQMSKSTLNFAFTCNSNYFLFAPLYQGLEYVRDCTSNSTKIHFYFSAWCHSHFSFSIFTLCLTNWHLPPPSLSILGNIRMSQLATSPEFGMGTACLRVNKMLCLLRAKIS